ncbi:MAG: alkaline phosphatase D family protein [Candidatus Hydrogenedentes bacterium]|nr:alkaline phosphatase D family protein [Candidatus Hydrogenedentota bacterium]
MARDFAFLSLTFLVLVGLAACAAAAEPSGVHMANGIKIGEVTQQSAIIWTRLTIAPERNRDGFPFPDVDGGRNAGADLSIKKLTGGHPLPDMEGSAPGAPGQVRVLWWPEGAPDAPIDTGWRPVDPDADFTRQFPIEGLAPATQYLLRVEGRPSADASPTCSLDGRFRTPPEPDAAVPVDFVVVTCQDYPRRDNPDKGHEIYRVMKAIDPDFFVHTGDIEYYDKALPYAPHQALARFKWNRLYAMPYQRSFHCNVSSYFIKDDHDTLKNDCWPGQHYGELTWEQGLAIFREQVPMGAQTYRTIRWGRDLQIWLVEGRDFRSPNSMPDGPEKTIWGPEQKVWFKSTVSASDATFRVLISPTPLVGPDRENKSDNHANHAFAHEGHELRSFIGAQRNMIVINGDRHWQYASIDDETGLREFGTGPSSDEHAGGWSQDDVRPQHRYLNLVGGFLRVTVTRVDGRARIRVRHCGIAGDVYNEVVIPAR